MPDKEWTACEEPHPTVSGILSIQELIGLMAITDLGA